MQTTPSSSSFHQSLSFFAVIALLIIISCSFDITTINASPLFQDEQQLEASSPQSNDCFPPSQREKCHSLTCINHTCQPCTNSDQCWQKVMICQPDPETGDGECVIQPLFGDGFDVWLMLTLICVLGVCIVGCIGGLGGGGAISPCIAGVAGFPMHDAVFLSLATIVGQAIVNVPAIMVCYDPEYSPDVKNSLTKERLHDRQEERNEIIQNVQQQQEQEEVIEPTATAESVGKNKSANSSHHQIVESSGPEIINKYQINNDDQQAAAASSPGALSTLEQKDAEGKVPSALVASQIETSDGVTHPIDDNASIPRSSFASPRLAPTRPLAAFDMLVMWFPACAAGTFVGELISRIIPNWLRMGFLFLLTCAITYRTATRSLALRKKEQLEAKKSARREAGGVETDGEEEVDDDDGDSDETDEEAENRKSVEAVDIYSGCSARSFRSNRSSPRKSLGPRNKSQDDVLQGEKAPLLSNSSFNSAAQQKQNTNNNKPNYTSGDDDDLHDLPSPSSVDFQTHPDSMPRLAILEIGLLILTIAIGVCVAHFILHGDLFECGSATFWGLIVVGTLIDMSVAIFYRARVARIAEKVARGITHRVKMPCKWNLKNSVVLPLASVSAGIGSQMFGLGGGSLVGPLLLEAGLPPERVSATGSVMTGVLGLQSMLVSAGGDTPPPAWSYIIIFGCIGAVSTVFGRFFALKEIKRRRATWLIVLCLSTILFLTIIASMTNGIINFVELLNYGAGTGMGRFCPVKK